MRLVLFFQKLAWFMCSCYFHTPSVAAHFQTVFASNINTLGQWTRTTSRGRPQMNRKYLRAFPLKSKFYSRGYRILGCAFTTHFILLLMFFKRTTGELAFWIRPFTPENRITSGYLLCFRIDSVLLASWQPKWNGLNNIFKKNPRLSINVGTKLYFLITVAKKTVKFLFFQIFWICYKGMLKFLCVFT